MTLEHDNKPGEPEARHLIGRAILERMRNVVDAGEGAFYRPDTDHLFETLYLTERQECVPDDLLGEDVMLDIIAIYYDVFSAIRAELDERLKLRERLQVYIQPDYHDVTFALMITDTRVLIKHSSKAWNFWWSSQEEMAEQLEKWYYAVERSLSMPLSPILEPPSNQDKDNADSGA